MSQGLIAGLINIYTKQAIFRENVAEYLSQKTKKPLDEVRGKLTEDFLIMLVAEAEGDALDRNILRMKFGITRNNRDYNFKEIAKELNVPYRTILQRKNKLLKRIKSNFENYNYDNFLKYFSNELGVSTEYLKSDRLLGSIKRKFYSKEIEWSFWEEIRENEVQSL